MYCLITLEKKASVIKDGDPIQFYLLFNMLNSNKSRGLTLIPQNPADNNRSFITANDWFGIFDAIHFNIYFWSYSAIIYHFYYYSL